MAKSLPTSRMPSTSRYAVVLLGIVGTAAGLNLTVMNIGAGPINETPEIALPATLGDPEVRQVLVDVPVPVREVDAPVSSAPNASAASAAAAPLPAAPPPAATPAPASAPPATTPAPTAPTAPPTTAAPATTSPPATTATTAAAPSTAPSTAPAPTTEYLTYSFDGVAQIVIAYHEGERLEFWSATPEDGWAYEVEKDRADHVEIKFRRVSGGEGEAKFELIREDGELEVKKER